MGWGLQRRMAAAFALLVGLMLALTAVGWWQTRGLGAQVERIVSVHNQRAELAHRLKAAQLDWSGQLRGLIVYTEPDDLKAQEAAVRTAAAQYMEAETALAPALQAGGEQGLLQQLARVRELRKEIDTPMSAVIRTAMAGSGPEASLPLLVPMEQGEHKWRREIAAIVTAAETANTAEHANARTRQAWTERVFLVLSAVALFLGIAMAIAITRSVTIPVDRAIGVAERIAQGDLGVAVHAGYTHEMGVDSSRRLR